MSFIDHTYFVGEINLPNTNEEDIQVRLKHFINIYEPKFLTELLGYDLYSSFIAGLQETIIEQKWVDLLYGNGIYKGLMSTPNGIAATVNSSNTLEMVVGRGRINDPVDGSNTTVIPDVFANVPTVLERRGIGQLLINEFSIDGNTLTLTNGTFNSGEIFFLKKDTTIGIAPAPSVMPISMIANYVYYWWMRNEATQTAGVGEVMTKTENSYRTSPATKMIKAWNDMVDMVWECMRFLQRNDYGFVFGYSSINSAMYRGYNTRGLSEIFYKINPLF